MNSPTTLTFTSHAQKRSAQRAISRRDIDITLRFGVRRRSHDSFTYTLTDRALSHTPYTSEADRLRGIQVVMSREGVVITVKHLFRVARRPGVLRRRLLALA